ncbi:Peptidase M48, Ste24p precursor [Alloactinosynnema sp. L-07]|uniref:M56 family metallopeptidase n=1 Tax=Alloactinosynnema sp. L-07 TaxID=1653480 RepID=UPI00065EF6AA|nr:M56 family metallopeptidase [Alloactinosynnema sp. L-07]CRK55141.1 Peptidase M48, Ste24p precursor [Alloactinosynnema sp. L-07]
MTFTVAMLLGAAVVAMLGPRWLSGLARRGVDPLVLFTAWIASIVSAVLMSTSAVVVLMVPDHNPVGDSFTFLLHGVTSVAHGLNPHAEELIGLVGTVLIACLTVRAAVLAIRSAIRRRRANRRYLAELGVSARTADGVLWLDHESPLAFSIAGPPGVIIATNGLNRTMSPAEVAAVLAHERAHLRGRHHLLVALADAVADALPLVPLAQRAPREFRVLAELSADTQAVRLHGRAALRAALMAVASGPTPMGSLGVTGGEITHRLRRLEHATGTGPLGKTVGCVTALLTAFTTPVVVALAVLQVAVLTGC